MPSQDSSPQAGESFVSHLIELRDRLLRSVLAVIVLFVIASVFANPVYEFFAKPLMDALPEGTSMISTEPHGPFFAPFKLAFFVAVVLAMPVLLYQIWAFVAPGLYEHERRLVVPLVASSTLLFYAGIAFAYFVVFPIIFTFFANTAPEGVSVMTDISAYLSFALKLFFAFGLAFEVPIATVILVRAGVATPDQLAAKRPYILVGAFVVGMLLTPPDIFSQTMLAIPVWILFEIGLYFSRAIKPKTRSEADAEMSEEEMESELAAEDSSGDKKSS